MQTVVEREPFTDQDLEQYKVTQNACKFCTPLGACLAFRGVESTIPFLHGSQGCATYIRRYLISHFKEPIDIASSSFDESTAVFGGEENLLYFFGFNRVGCFPCLAAGDKYKEEAFRFDETGRKHFLLVKELEPVVGRSVFTSKGGQERNPCEGGPGCAFCEI